MRRETPETRTALRDFYPSAPTPTVVGRDWRLERGLVAKTLEQRSKEISKLVALGGGETSQAIRLGLENDGQRVLGEVGPGFGQVNEDATAIVRAGRAIDQSRILETVKANSHASGS
jgi:hypothetical protein